jgi:hypothetical protein
MVCETAPKREQHPAARMGRSGIGQVGRQAYSPTSPKSGELVFMKRLAAAVCALSIATSACSSKSTNASPPAPEQSTTTQAFEFPDITTPGETTAAPTTSVPATTSAPSTTTTTTASTTTTTPVETFTTIVPTDADRASIEDFLKRYDRAVTEIGESLDPDYQSLEKWHDPESDALDKILPLFKQRLANGRAIKAGESSFRFAYLPSTEADGDEYRRVVDCKTDRDILYAFNNPATTEDDVIVDSRELTTQSYWILKADNGSWLVNDVGILRERTTCETNPFT